MNNFPRTFNNEKTVNLIKRRFCETAEQAGINVPTYVVASTNPDFWDFRRMVQSKFKLTLTPRTQNFERNLPGTNDASNAISISRI